jgi:hypothetical protein
MTTLAEMSISYHPDVGFISRTLEGAPLAGAEASPDTAREVKGVRCARVGRNLVPALKKEPWPMNAAGSVGPVVLVLLLLALPLLFILRQSAAKAREHPVSSAGKSPEDLKADRLAREARARELLADQFTAGRVQWSGWLQILGGFLMLIGFWFLVLDPGSNSASVVSLQKLCIGQTAAIVGSILFVAGLLLKYLR